MAAYEYLVDRAAVIGTTDLEGRAFYAFGPLRPPPTPQPTYAARHALTARSATA